MFFITDHVRIRRAKLKRKIQVVHEDLQQSLQNMPNVVFNFSFPVFSISMSDKFHLR